jgi:hypothetical protein
VRYKTGDILMVKGDMTYSLCEVLGYDLHGNFVLYLTHDCFGKKDYSLQLKDKFIKIGEL